MRSPAWLLCLPLALATCRERYPLEFEVTPPSVAPGEPLHLQFAAPPMQPVEVELVDASGDRLAQTTLEPGVTAAWLYPSQPQTEGALTLRARPTMADTRGRWTRVVVPLDLDRPVINASYGVGLSAPTEATQYDESYRWTEGCSDLLLEDIPGDALVHLFYRCGLIEPQRFTLGLGSAEFELPCEEGWYRARVVAPRSLWGGSPVLAVQLVIAPTFRPILNWDSGDTREMGIQLYSVLGTLDSGATKQAVEAARVK